MYERYAGHDSSMPGDVISGTAKNGVVKYRDGSWRVEYNDDEYDTIEAYLADNEPVDMQDGLPPEPEPIPSDDVVERLTPWMTPMQAARWWYKWGPEGYARKEWLAWAEKARTICEVQAAAFIKANPTFYRDVLKHERRSEWHFANRQRNSRRW